MTPVILRSRALARRLEGWATTRQSSFEARRRRLAPQDDVGMCGHQSYFAVQKTKYCGRYILGRTQRGYPAVILSKFAFKQKAKGETPPWPEQISAIFPKK